jgi:hypothetical protein
MKKPIIFVFLFVLAAGLASAQLHTDEYGQQGLRLMMKVDTYTDGSRSIEHFVLDPDTGEPLPMQAAADMFFTEEEPSSSSRPS